MKNKWILLGILSFSIGKVFATHYRGGEITFKVTGAYSIEATITTYSKISGVSAQADRDSVIINWGDGTSDLIYRINGPASLNSIPAGILVGTDIKQNIYMGNHTYAGPPAGSNYYVVNFADPDRLAGIVNMNNSENIPLSVSDSIYMGSNISSISGGFDASPVFLNFPQYYNSVADTLTFNSAAFDPDGDSLSYSLITPQQDENVAVSDYTLPGAYCQQNSFPLNNFQIDAQTGEIIWATPCLEGYFQFAIELREYRCGVFIGDVVRDMQIISLQYASSPPRLSQVRDTVIEPGQLIAYNISSTDPDSSLIDSLQILGEAFLDSFTPPVFQSSNGNPATGTFSWQPSGSYSRPTAYAFTVISSNNIIMTGPDGPAPFPLTDMETFRVWVKDTSAPCSIMGINNPSEIDLELNIFPNPTNAILHIQTSQQVSNILVSDLSGREVLNTNTNCSNCDLPVSKLENGVYLLSVVADNLAITRKFIKIE